MGERREKPVISYSLGVLIGCKEFWKGLSGQDREKIGKVVVVVVVVVVIVLGVVVVVVVMVVIRGGGGSGEC